jgi:2-methylisocitrate lyase-like PEP mutase family enzyme
VLIPVAEMVGKLEAAQEARLSDEFMVIARTDARSVLGLDEAIQRAKTYHAAGADLIFVESPHTKDELQFISESLPGIPLMANMGMAFAFLSVEHLSLTTCSQWRVARRRFARRKS